jgi:hypothetical protein
MVRRLEAAASPIHPIYGGANRLVAPNLAIFERQNLAAAKFICHDR